MSVFICPKCNQPRRHTQKSKAHAGLGWCTLCVREYVVHRAVRTHAVQDYRDVLPPYKLVEFRARYGITQAALANILGVSPATVSSWEQGHTATPLMARLSLSAYVAGLPPYAG